MRKIVFILVAVMLIIQPVIASEHTRKMETAADADSWIRVFLGDPVNQFRTLCHDLAHGSENDSG